MKPRRIEPLWHVVSPDGGLLVEVATGDRGYCARRPGERWHSGLYVGGLIRAVVTDLAALLHATRGGAAPGAGSSRRPPRG
jgi:hypothetical protein